MATSGSLHMATSGYFFMATEKRYTPSTRVAA